MQDCLFSLVLFQNYVKLIMLLLDVVKVWKEPVLDKFTQSSLVI